ncbi:hypothetical protein [Eikenella corrodens]|uniref:hypothetical protein n=1 Tax=Eikenella corrodens TaxID=539 RepID=UPI0012DA5D9C|nr:hypothetical protein [Eikenella corrodens]
MKRLVFIPILAIFLVSCTNFGSHRTKLTNSQSMTRQQSLNTLQAERAANERRLREQLSRDRAAMVAGAQVCKMDLDARNNPRNWQGIVLASRGGQIKVRATYTVFRSNGVSNPIPAIELWDSKSKWQICNF